MAKQKNTGDDYRAASRRMVKRYRDRLKAKGIITATHLIPKTEVQKFRAVAKFKGKKIDEAYREALRLYADLGAPECRYGWVVKNGREEICPVCGGYGCDS